MKNATIERETLWRVVEKEWVDDEGFPVVSCDVYQDGVHVSEARRTVWMHPPRALAKIKAREEALTHAGVFG